MLTIGDIVAYLRADDSQLDGDLSQGEKKATGWVGRIGESLKGAMSTALGFLGANLIQRVMGGIAETGEQIFRGALDAQAGLEAMRGTLETLGDKTDVTEDQILGLAESYKHLAGGSDDAVIAIDTVLARMGVQSAQMEQATQVTLDLAAALKIDTATAANLAGKALLVPGEGTRALKAAGVALTDELEDQIDAMMLAGDTAGAQQLVLDVLAETTGGAAAKAAGTLAGKWTIFKETLMDAGEGIALSLLPTLSTLFDKVLAPAVPVVQALAGVLATAFSGGDIYGGSIEALSEALDTAFGEDTSDAIIGFIDRVVAGISGIVAFVQANLPLIQATLATVFGAANQILGAFGGLIQGTILPVLAGLFGQITTGAPSAQTVFTTVMTDIQVGAKLVADFVTTQLVPALTQIFLWLGTNLPPVIQAVSGFLTTYLIPAITQVAAWLGTNLPPAIAAVAGFLNDTLIPVLTELWNFISTYVVPVLSALATVVIAGLNLALTGIAKLWNETLEPALSALLTMFRDNIGPSLEWFRTNVLDPLGKSLESVAAFFKDIATKINDFNAGLGGLELPAWLTPGSPTPFELGLRGAAGAAAELAEAVTPLLDSLARQGNLSMDLTTNAARAAAAAAVQAAQPAMATAGAPALYVTFAPGSIVIGHGDAETVARGVDLGIQRARRAMGAV